MFDIPVLLIVFNRLDTVEKQFEMLKKIQPSKLYIAADGARTEKKDESNKCQIVRDYIKENVTWKCELKTLYQEKNIGCDLSVSGALDWLFFNEEMGIILEDDCLPVESFFYFCKKLLNVYKNEDKIFSISGTNINDNLTFANDYFFSFFGGNWGWATWRRAWNAFSFDIDNLCIKKNYIECEKNLKIRGVHKWLPKFVNKKTLAWDYKWMFIRFLNNKLTIVPCKNMIANIGFREDSTHTSDSDSEFSNLQVFEIKSDDIEKKDEIKSNTVYDEFFNKKFSCHSYNLLKKARKLFILFAKKIHLYNPLKMITTQFYLVLKKSPFKIHYKCLYDNTVVIFPEATINNMNRITSINIGSNSRIRGNLQTSPHGGFIKIGDWCYVGAGTRIWSSKSIVIGNNVLISHNVNIFDDTTHPINPLLRRLHSQQIFTTGFPSHIDVLDPKPISIDDDAWICCSSVILRGVHIGKGAIVSAGSVVTKDVPDFTIVGGNPATVKKRIEKPEDYDFLLTQAGLI